MYFKKRDYRRLHSPAWAFGSVGVVLMLQILVFIADSKTHRWFRLEGIGTLQPSEFAKPALLIFLAYFVTQRARNSTPGEPWRPFVFRCLCLRRQWESATWGPPS